MHISNKIRSIATYALAILSCLTLLNASQHTAIIVPMRNREAHLQQLKNRYIALANKHRSLIRIVVAEQDDQERYNAGRSRNIGFAEAIKLNPSHVIFNDVDTWLRTDDIWKNMIRPPSQSQCKLLCYNANERLNGVFSFLPADYIKTNGFPNDYDGWGPEDIVVYYRAMDANISVWRYPNSNRLRYKRTCCDEDVNHPRDKENLSNLHAKFDQWKSNTTGLSDLQYTITKQTTEQLSDYVTYSHIWFK